MRRVVLLAGLGLACACAGLELDPPREIIHARFDPEAGVIPMPTDILRDDEVGRLDIPLDGDLTATERELYQYLNTRDGWSTTMPARVEFSDSIDEATVTAETLQVWHLRATPSQVDDVTMHLSSDDRTITIDPPRAGWERGGRYVVLVRGGAAGIEGKRGERVEADAAFYFLRLQQALDSPEHERAFPGATREERMQNARDLEEIRASLEPHFDFFAERGIARNEVASLWSFTVTDSTELATDKASQRMPLPIDLLLDPVTGRVDLPVASWDSDIVTAAKQELKKLDGFSTSGNIIFGFTGPMDVSTLSEQTIRLFHDTAVGRSEIAIEVHVLEDARHVELELVGGPLAEKSRYLVALSSDIRDIDGKEISLMPAAVLMGARNPVVQDGQSQVGSIEDADAARIETVRSKVAGLHDSEELLFAWSFETQSISEPMQELLATPERVDVDPDPVVYDDKTALQALGDFPLGVTSIGQVERVYYGTIKGVELLDPQTRGMRTDGGHELIDIHFAMTIPKGLEDGDKVPVAMFGHGLSSERRFVLALGNALAARGYAAIAIDMPFHGLRTSCFQEDEAREALNPATGEIEPTGAACAGDATCSPTGQCVNADGSQGKLNIMPVLGQPSASGQTYIEIDTIANTADHFRQSLVDLRTLHRSLREGDWQSQVGFAIDTADIQYVGLSLGGILGSMYVAATPELERAVLNVPGANSVEVFASSPLFSQRIDALLEREGVERGEYEAQKLLAAAHWITDRVDPQNFAARLSDDSHDVLVQMAIGDFVIPNEFTELLVELAGVPKIDYLGTHGFLNLPLEPEFWRGVNDMADHLAGVQQ